MFVHSTSWGSLAIMLVMDHSMTRKIRFPAFSSLPPLQVVRKYLIFGLVGANLFARSGVIMEALLWVSMIVYERWDFWGQFSQRKSTRTILLQDTPLVKGLWQTEMQAVFSSLPCFIPAMEWQLTPHLAHFTTALHSLDLCPANKHQKNSPTLRKHLFLTFSVCFSEALHSAKRCLVIMVILLFSRPRLLWVV